MRETSLTCLIRVNTLSSSYTQLQRNPFHRTLLDATKLLRLELKYTGIISYNYSILLYHCLKFETNLLQWYRVVITFIAHSSENIFQSFVNIIECVPFYSIPPLSALQQNSIDNVFFIPSLIGKASNIIIYAWTLNVSFSMIIYVDARHLNNVYHFGVQGITFQTLKAIVLFHSTEQTLYVKRKIYIFRYVQNVLRNSRYGHTSNGRCTTQQESQRGRNKMYFWTLSVVAFNLTFTLTFSSQMTMASVFISVHQVWNV